MRLMAVPHGVGTWLLQSGVRPAGQLPARADLVNCDLVP